MGVVLEGEERIEDLVDETELSRYEVRLVDGLAGEKELELKKAGTTSSQLQKRWSRSLKSSLAR